MLFHNVVKIIICYKVTYSGFVRMKGAAYCYLFYFLLHSPYVFATDPIDKKYSLISGISDVQLNLPTFKDGSHHYYHELLQQSLSQAGHHVTIRETPHQPQTRTIQDLIDSRISLYWLICTAERDQLFTPIKIKLTEGMIGRRVLLIPQNQQKIYNSITTLNEFRQLNVVGVFGTNWFDAEVWKHNRLLFIIKNGDWREIYRPLAENNRGIDYFSRGIIEILAEHKLHPYLDIEQRLLFEYDNDFCFYLSDAASRYQKVIEHSLKLAESSGLKASLIKKYWGNDLEALNVNSRITLKLESPASLMSAEH